MSILRSYRAKCARDIVWIGLLEVDRALQRQEIAGKILAALEDVCKRMGRLSLQIGVLKDNLSAQAFWIKAGFQLLDETDCGEYGLLIMEKRL